MNFIRVRLKKEIVDAAERNLNNMTLWNFFGKSVVHASMQELYLERDSFTHDNPTGIAWDCEYHDSCCSCCACVETVGGLVYNSKAVYLYYKINSGEIIKYRGTWPFDAFYKVGNNTRRLLTDLSRT